MSKPNFSKVGRSYPSSIIQQNITSYSMTMISQDISMWKNAINSAWSKLNPDRRRLQEMFMNLIIDGHTEAVIEKRISAISNRKIEYYVKDQDGETPDNIREYITGAPWFQDFIKYAMEAVAFGYSTIELLPKKGIIQDVALIDRRNIIPEQDMLLFDMYKRTEGINYFEDPKYSKYLIHVGKNDQFGKMLTAAQYIIYKRGGFGDWSQFIEIYGMPTKVGKYKPFDEYARKKLDESFTNQGANAHWVIPEGASIDFIETSSQGKSEVFRDMIHLCNSEISKIFLGQTLTTDPGQNGARALGDIHKEVEESINLADSIRMEYLLNWVLADKLNDLGFNLPEGRFVFPHTIDLPLDKRIKIDMEVAKQVPISDEYWYNTYGVERGDAIKQNKPDGDDPEGNDLVDDEEKDGNKKKPKPKEPAPPKKPNSLNEVASFQVEIAELYGTACTDCNSEVIMAADVFDAIWDDLAQKIFNGDQMLIDEALVLATADQLTSALTSSGLGRDGFQPDKAMINRLKQNVQVFSGFKTYHQLKEASALLLDDQGNLKSFSAFRSDVKEISKTYNDHWLRSEYNHAVACGDMAARWQEFEDNAEGLPNLTYRTASDERVRQTHRALQGVTRPITDSFWSTYYPPNGWGCRCTVTQGIEPVTDLKKVDAPEVPEMFMNNVAKDGVVFPQNHPFFKVADKHKTTLISELDDIFSKASKRKPKAKKATEPTWNPNIPEELQNYPVAIDPKFWEQFDKPVNLIFDSKKGAHYQPWSNTVSINRGQRFQDDWYKAKIIYHEFGHALHDQKGWVTYYDVDIRVKRAFKEAKKTFKVQNESIGETYARIHSKFKPSYAEQFREVLNLPSDNAFDECIGAVADTFAALSKGKIGYGHSKSYWKGNFPEMEFFAHAMEYIFQGNKYLDQEFPEIAKIFVDLGKELLTD